MSEAEVDGFPEPPGPTDDLIALLEEGVTSAWCDAAIGCLPHIDPKRGAKFRDHFYDWQRRARAAIAKAEAGR